MSSLQSLSSTELSPRVAIANGHHIDNDRADRSATMEPSEHNSDLAVFNPGLVDPGLTNDFDIPEACSASIQFSTHINSCLSSVSGPPMCSHSYHGQFNTTNGFNGGNLLSQSGELQSVNPETGAVTTSGNQGGYDMGIDGGWSQNGEVDRLQDSNFEAGNVTRTERTSAMLHTASQLDGRSSSFEMVYRGPYLTHANHFEGQGFSNDDGEDNHYMAQGFGQDQINGPQDGTMVIYNAQNNVSFTPNAPQGNASLPPASQLQTQGVYANNTNTAYAQNSDFAAPHAAQNTMALPPAAPQPSTQAVDANSNGALAPPHALVPHVAQAARKLRSRWTDEDVTTLEQLMSLRPKLSNKDMGEILGKTANAVYLKRSRKYDGKFAQPHKAAKERKRLQELANPAPM